MDTTSLDIAKIVWPTYWLIAPVILGIITHFSIQTLKKSLGWQALQPLLVYSIAGIFLGALFWFYTGSWATGIAALLWVIIPSPAIQFVIGMLTELASWIWNKAGGM